MPAVTGNPHIEAVSEQVPSDEEYLVTPAVLKLLRDCRAGFL